MGIKLVTSLSAIEKEMQRETARIDRAMLKILSDAGESAVKAARDHEGKEHPFETQTGNLQSSMGYVVAIDGKVQVKSDFSQVKDGADGVKKGAAYIEEIVEQFAQNNKYVLVVVAGMEYASYVSNRGYDVLDSGELIARKVTGKLMDGLIKRRSKRQGKK